MPLTSFASLFPIFRRSAAIGPPSALSLEWTSSGRLRASIPSKSCAPSPIRKSPENSHSILSGPPFKQTTRALLKRTNKRVGDKNSDAAWQQSL